MASGRQFLDGLLNGYRELRAAIIGQNDAVLPRRNIARLINVTAVDNPNTLDADGNIVGSTDLTFAAGGGTIGGGGPRFDVVRDFGAVGDAKFFNASNGRWYKDAGLTLEATDDAPAFRAADAAVSAAALLSPSGTASVHIPGQNFYFKTLDSGGGGEFIHCASGVCWYGEGDGSAIKIAPMSTAWSTVFGQNPSNLTPTPIHFDEFRNFSIDLNQKFNQRSGFGGTPNLGAITLPAGKGNRVYRVTVYNPNSVFAIQIGQYDLPLNSPDFEVSFCRLLNVWDDPALVDSSLFSISGDGGLLIGNLIDWGGSANLNNPSGVIATGMEIHGFRTRASGNTLKGLGDAFNVAADSADAGQLVISDNTIFNCISMVDPTNLNGKVGRGLTICGNNGTIRASGNSLTPETGIGYTQVTALGFGVAYGLGWHDVEIYNNTIIGAASPTANSEGIRIQQAATGGGSVTPAAWISTHTYNQNMVPSAVQGPTMGSSGQYFVPLGGSSNGNPTHIDQATGVSGSSATVFDGRAINDQFVDGGSGGVVWLCAGVLVGGVIPTGGGTKVHHNTIRNFAAKGIRVTTPGSVQAGNLMQDVHIENNDILNCGSQGVYVSGSTSDTSPDFVGLLIANNRIRDNRGGGSALVNAIYVTAWTDSSSVLDVGNIASGYTGAKTVFDTSTFPSLAESWPFEQFSAIQAYGNVGVSIPATAASLEVAGMTLAGNTGATSGAPTQHPPGLHFLGSYYAGGASHLFDGWWEAQSSASPSMSLAMRTGGSGPYTYPFGVTSYAAGYTGWSGAGSKLLVDMSGTSGASIQENVSSTGFWSVLVNSAQMMKVGNQTHGNFIECNVPLYGNVSSGNFEVSCDGNNLTFRVQQFTGPTDGIVWLSDVAGDATNFLALYTGAGFTHINGKSGVNIDHGGSTYFQVQSFNIVASAPLYLQSQAAVTTAAVTGGAASALPANPVGYVTLNYNGTAYKVPVYT